MSADIQLEDGTQERPACSPETCSKKQAGMCSKDQLRPQGNTTEKATSGMPRVERRSKLRQLLIQDKGQSLIEFALTAPFLLMLVTGIAAFGIAFNNYLMLTEAVSVGARQLTVSRGQTTDPCKTFSNAVYAAAPLLRQSNLTFTISLAGTAYPGTTCSGSATAGAPSNMVLGTNAIVMVTYPVSVTIWGLKVVPTGSVLTAQLTELMQ